MLTVVAVQGYRSLHDIVLPLAGLTVVTGANGSGKSSVYRVLRLLAEASRGGVVAALAREGGLSSVLWAGPEALSREAVAGEHPVQGTRRRGPVALRVGFAGEEYGYAVDLGLPTPSPGWAPTMFGRDPQVKRESVWAGPVLRRSTLLTDRTGNLVMWQDAEGRLVDSGRRVAGQDSVLSEVADVQAAPELLVLREQLRSWRFYDGFRTDPASAARVPRPGTFSPVLSDDGGNLPSALQTITELDPADPVVDAVQDAFPGSRVQVVDRDGLFGLQLHHPGLLRPLDAAELSDGTLRYLLLVAALLTPRPPQLLVLNEPETSLHPDLLPSLGRLVVHAAARTQTVVVTHSRRLRDAITDASATGDAPARAGQAHGAAALVEHELLKQTGMTTVAGQGRLDAPPWYWPSR